MNRRQFAAGATTLLLAPVNARAGSTSVAGAGGSADNSKYVHLLDPELRDAGLLMRRTTAAFTPMTVAKLAARRAWMQSNAPPPLESVRYKTQMIARSGAADVGVIVVNAAAGRNGAGLLHLHGGGFTSSSALLSLRSVQELAATLNCTIVTVDYRLAPETIWSGSLDDNYTALLWTHAHAEELGIDRGRLAVLGESAGGGHAALLALTARDRGQVKLKFQALVYPMLDDRTGSSRLPPPHIGYFGWNADANRFGWRSFLGCDPGGPLVPSGAVPARVSDLSGLPPTWIGVGGLDLFVDECVDYAARLNSAAVPTELLLVPGAFHGFDSFAKNADISRRFTLAKLAVLRRALK